MEYQGRNIAEKSLPETVTTRGVILASLYSAMSSLTDLSERFHKSHGINQERLQVACRDLSTLYMILRSNMTEEEKKFFSSLEAWAKFPENFLNTPGLKISYLYDCFSKMEKKINDIGITKIGHTKEELA